MTSLQSATAIAAGHDPATKAARHPHRHGPRRYLPASLHTVMIWAVALVMMGLGTTLAATPVSIELLASKRESIDKNQELSEDAKKSALSMLDEARANIEEFDRLARQTEALRQRIDGAPQRIRQLRDDSQAKRDSGADPPLAQSEIESLDLEQIEDLLSRRQQLLAKARAEQAENERELADLVSFARTGSQEMASSEARLNELAQIGGKSASGEIEKLRQEAAEQRLRARIAWLRLRLDQLPLLSELIQLERDHAAARLSSLSAEVGVLREQALLRRQTAVERAQLSVQDEAQALPPPIRELLGRLSALTDEQRRLVEQEFELERQQERTQRISEEVQRDYQRIQQIAELGGAKAEVSRMLQKRRALAPSPQSLASEVIGYQQLLGDKTLRQLEIDEILRQTHDAPAQIQALMGADPAADPELYRAVEQSWTSYRSALSELWRSHTRFIGTLSALEATTRQLIEEVRNYREFIDDRLLWMPSTGLVPLHEPAMLLTGIAWYIAPENVARLVNDIWSLATQQVPLVGLWSLALLILFGMRRRALQRLADAASATQKVRSDRIGLTFSALGSTLILVLPLPWLIIGAGMLLSAFADASEYSIIVGVGLQSAGHSLLFLSLLRHLCRNEGLARYHLQWSPELCDNLVRQAIWLTPIAVPLAFLSAAGAASVPSAFIQVSGLVQADEPGVMSIGRLAAVALLLLLSVAVYRVWRKNGSVMQAMAASEEQAHWANYHVLWFSAALMLPIGVSLAAASGFYYTAMFLLGKAGETLWFLILLVVIKDMSLRSLRVTQRRLRFQEALRYREEAQAQRKANPAGQPASSGDSGELSLEEEKIDYGQLGEQARKLVHLGYMIGLLTGLWWIWSSVVPAFRFLDKIELPIVTSRLIDGVSQDVPLTLGDMGAGLLLGALALFAARNIPALLELTLLQRLPLSRASRYAFTTLTQYAVAMTGLVITFSALGLQWSSVQWLVAALSVGLGFGLQEIVANFISGIILLFEQPIRVGDVVTVNNTTGTVSRIRIRATTIVNWERQELVIPNKAFITGELINWTLSDTVNRLTIRVGVSYDTDTRLALQIMQDAAVAHPRVTEDPAPRVVFEGFGDNSLNLMMVAYLSDLDNRISTLSELHQDILDRFRAADIEISFPQRDIHLDTRQPLELILKRQR